MIHLEITQIKNLWSNLKFEDRSSDFLSYKYFVHYFSNIEKITEENFIIWSNFCYGWMPRMLTIKEFSSLPSIIEILNKAKNQDSYLNINELNILKTSINNSIVWVSKLLHFINPRKYPIWDSRVWKIFHLKDINNVNLYKEYMDEVTRFCNENSTYVEEITQILWKRMGYSISWIRAIEFILFQAGTKNAK